MTQKPGKYYNMLLAILTMITALSISAVAIYYSVAGLVAIFAAAAIPIMIMGGTLEIAKLVTAVWLHRYWSQATWWLRYYLATAVVVLMFITSMGIFGYLSKAHIEQTSASEESIAQVEQITTELARLNAVVDRSEQKIGQLESSGTGSDANIQSQIDKEQDRIDKAYDRIKPAIAQQNQIISDARLGDEDRIGPYNTQLENIANELIRLSKQAGEYEATIATLKADSSAVDPIIAQINAINTTITKVEGQIASNEREQIKQAQSTIGANADGSAGPNTRRSANAWIETQKEIVNGLNNQVATIRNESKATVDAERTRLSDIVNNIRTVQIPSVKTRELEILKTIDEVRQKESPVIATALTEIARIRASADTQVLQSQSLIERLQKQLAQTDKADEIDTAVDEQLTRIKTAEGEIDILTEEKYKLEAEYRMLEAEVGPIKYIAEFVYGESADKTMLEEAVRWVILIIIFVFDPLAVLLLIASQYTFDFARDSRREKEQQDYETARGNMIAKNEGPAEDRIEPVFEDVDQETLDHEFDEEKLQDLIHEQTDDQSPNLFKAPFDDTIRVAPTEQEYEVEEPKKKAESSEESNSEELTAEQQARKDAYEEKDKTEEFLSAKNVWKDLNPNETLKQYKKWYIQGVIDTLPWEDDEKYAPKTYIKQNSDGEQVKGYQQNAEQNDETIFNKLKK
tara:strand:+ start:7454 stop:9517 length:2064 start_codon:yes stop_codon:yes gene_type:complete